MKPSIAKYEAFKKIIESGKAKTMKRLIYNELIKESRTIIYFRGMLKIPHQSCTGQLSSLEDTGWIYKEKTIKINDKSFTLYNAETNSDKARERAIQVENHKKKEWVIRGFKNGWFDENTAKNIAIQLKLEL